ncbi:hypothetical protein ACVWW5_004644 [Bradyrhizobium sp. LM3.4]
MVATALMFSSSDAKLEPSAFALLVNNSTALYAEAPADSNRDSGGTSRGGTR